MTFCLGMRVRDGIVGIADTRVTSGSECITAESIDLSGRWLEHVHDDGRPAVGPRQSDYVL